MNAFKCDRCGKLFERYLEMKADDIYKITPNSTGCIRFLDLCENCNNEFQDWVNAFKKKEEGEIPNETNNDFSTLTIKENEEDDIRNKDQER